MKNVYQHEVELKAIKINNCTKKEFADTIMALPYRGYEVEAIEDGRKIVITKPGGKSVHGQPKKDDFIVFILNPRDNTLWQISHRQILDDIREKLEENEKKHKSYLC